VLTLFVMGGFDLNVGVENLAAAVADLQEFSVRDGHGVSLLASISEANEGTLRPVLAANRSRAHRVPLQIAYLGRADSGWRNALAVAHAVSNRQVGHRERGHSWAPSTC